MGSCWVTELLNQRQKNTVSKGKGKIPYSCLLSYDASVLIVSKSLSRLTEGLSESLSHC